MRFLVTIPGVSPSVGCFGWASEIFEADSYVDLLTKVEEKYSNINTVASVHIKVVPDDEPVPFTYSPPEDLIEEGPSHVSKPVFPSNRNIKEGSTEIRRGAPVNAPSIPTDPNTTMPRLHKMPGPPLRQLPPLDYAWMDRDPDGDTHNEGIPK